MWKSVSRFIVLTGIYLLVAFLIALGLMIIPIILVKYLNVGHDQTAGWGLVAFPLTFAETAWFVWYVIKVIKLARE